MILKSCYDDLMKIEIAYVPDENIQELLDVELDEGALVKDAVEKSGLLNKYQAVGIESLQTGIWGKVCSLDTVLKEHDRVELYVPLLISPKTARRKRAQK